MRFAVPNTTVLVADGGLATTLEAAGFDLSDPLWSARLLLDAPDAITATHERFFRAGADIATTASYQVSFAGFADRGVDAAQTTAVLHRSVALARGAATRIGGRRTVAASIGPYGAALADGAEYRGRYGLSVAQLAAWHRPRLEVLAAAGADVLACETIPDVDEAEALVGLLTEVDAPGWLSYTIAGQRTRAGQPLAEAFALADAADQVCAVGVNCCDPADVAPAIEIAAAVTDTPVIVYPNSGERWHHGRWSGPPTFTAAAAADWVDAGARIVGGCCRVGPTQIAALARRLAGRATPGRR
ncbi:homocysteine S-methyltransferase [Mycolicibacillus koreensis]|uniref:homocysteine S-methyltransferase n=1 Tax=Mycolicibacillus koreensis TaxID=1069220 RepID=UPI000848734C|nr:homocysteine S-methyltransferase [Mycolicibacillus koreensis]ODR05624.1 homocysteine S-methyltransferase [Mycolicibacillus koreensis]BBY53059.1 homocysteine S-methyltransferase [Mycolicibacillus koreensis]